MTLNTRARATALRLIDKYGKTVTYTHAVDGVYDPATGSAAPTETTYTIKAVVEDYTLRQAGAGFQSGLIRDGDKQITIPAQGITFTPLAGDKVTVDGITYTALNIKVTYGGEDAAIHVVHGRQ
jgi:hypothetical protein